MEKSERFANGAMQTLMQAPCTVVADGRKYRVRQVGNKVKERIMLLELEAQVLEAKGKEKVSIKEGRRIARNLYSLYAKKAAYYLLGNWAIFCPWLWAIRWRLLQLRTDEVTFKINSAGAIGEDMGFSKANLQLSRQERELYMRQVGEAAKQWQERWESVQNMLEKDASGVKEENR